MIYTDLYKKKRKRCITVKIYDIFERFRQQGKNSTACSCKFYICSKGILDVSYRLLFLGQKPVSLDKKGNF